MQSSILAPTASLGAEIRRQLQLAWPVVVGMIGSMGMGVVDTVMVGSFGGDALAGVALAFLWGWAVMVLPRGAAKGMDPLISQAFGAGNRERAGRTLVHGLVFALLLSGPVAVLHLVAAPGLALLGQPVELLPLARDYSVILAIGVPAALSFAVFQQFLQGLGRMKPATVAVLVANVVNIGLNRLFMHGLGPWEGLGPIGCAWSSVLGLFFMLGLLLWLVRDLLRDWWPTTWRQDARDLPAIRHLATLGFPVGLQIAIETWGFQAAGVMIGWMGATQLAAHTITMNLATVAFMTPLGISAAAATRIGNLVGAGQRWGRAAAVAVVMGATAMILSALVFRLLPEQLARVYTPDPEVLAVAVALIPIAGAFQLFDGVQVVGFGVLRGLADVRAPVVLNIVGYWLLGLPTGWLLGFHFELGPQGVWYGLVLSLALVATMLMLRIGWLHRKGVSAL